MQCVQIVFNCDGGGGGAGADFIDAAWILENWFITATSLVEVSN